MALILKNVLSEEVSVTDFRSWLLSDSLENSLDKAEFIPYFLNFLKDNCAWLLAKNGKNVETTTNKLLTKVQDTSFNNKYTSQTKSSDNDRIRGSDRNCQNNERSYHDNGFKRRVKTSGVPLDDKNRDERNLRKQDCGARKSLNFGNTGAFKSISSKYEDDSKNVPDINSHDEFPSVGTKVTKNQNDSKVKRRITPTPIQVVQKGSTTFGNSKFIRPSEKVTNEAFKRTPLVESSNSDLQKEREMLKMTRNQFSHSPSSLLSNSVNNLKVESISPVKCITVHYISPDLDKVSRKNELEIFSIIYDLLISNALVPNVTSELYYIFELITTKALPEDKTAKDNIFCSIHNCVYFAASVLSKLTNFLLLLDNNTLSSLCEIPYLSNFSSQLVKFLCENCNEIQEICSNPQSLNTVPFILEEDTSDNFINAHAFTSFRKQRDLFYELLRDWQKQSLDTIDSQFRDGFHRKAKNLINLGPNSVNIYHLAKLFENQLIASCLGLEVNEVFDELLNDIQKNFPGKIEKLRQRFMKPFCVGVPNPPPTFYGIQAFFSELIQAANSAILNQHLQDIFVSKILELNTSDIFSDGESSSVTMIKEKYVFLLHTLRLLGKFLGYLQFLPYKVSEPLSVNIISQQLISRKNSATPLDLPKLLKLAIENNRMILTVPWIVEYLSMADSVGKCLPYVEESLEILAAVYRGKYFINTESLNFGLLRLIIGWLFDILCYPPKYYSLIEPLTFKRNLEHKEIDFLPVIDKQLVHSCCPYLVEFKVLVYGFLNGIKNSKKREIRKITPLSTAMPVKLPSFGKQQTQIQLEENFFFIQPPSVKKTVEFVSDRIASKVIQKIRTEVTDFKLQSVDYITNQEAYKTLLTGKSPSKRFSYIDSCILKLFEKSQSKITDYIHVLCPKDIRSIMPILLSDDIKAPILNMCCEIAIRVSVDKIVDWCNANLILRDITIDIKNKINHLLKDVDHAEEGDFKLSALLMSLRETTIKNFSAANNLQFEYGPLLTEVLSIMNMPVGYSTRKLIAFLSIDLCFSIMTYYPQNFNDECKKGFISIWSFCSENYNLEHYFLGVQNIKFLINGENLVCSCEKLGHMLTELIEKKVFSLTKLQKCLVKFKSCDWKDAKAKTIMCFLSNVLNSCVSCIPNKNVCHS